MGELVSREQIVYQVNLLYHANFDVSPKRISNTLHLPISDGVVNYNELILVSHRSLRKVWLWNCQATGACLHKLNLYVLGGLNVFSFCDTMVHLFLQELFPLAHVHDLLDDFLHMPVFLGLALIDFNLPVVNLLLQGLIYMSIHYILDLIKVILLPVLLVLHVEQVLEEVLPVHVLLLHDVRQVLPELHKALLLLVHTFYRVHFEFCALSESNPIFIEVLLFCFVPAKEKVWALFNFPHFDVFFEVDPHLFLPGIKLFKLFSLHHLH